MPLKVCFFGSYAKDYARNRILLKALRAAGFEVLERRSDIGNPLLRYRRLWRICARDDFDLILSAFPSAWDVPLARALSLAKRCPLIFDAHLSLYDSMVHDRRQVSEGSLSSVRLFGLDKVSCTLADVVLLDTLEHIKYFVKTFKVPPSKFRRVWVGSDDEVFYPRRVEKTTDKFVVFFYGSFIPLQGVPYIVKAAKLLQREKDLIFKIVGRGQTFNYVFQLTMSLKVNNVTFLGWVDYYSLPNYIAEADVCLGVFGDTPKTLRVIPNKVYDALAMAKPVITGNTPAIREALTHGVNVWLCRVADPRSLADAILTLKEDRKLREKIALNGYQLFKKKFSIKAIGNLLKLIINEIMTSL